MKRITACAAAGVLAGALMLSGMTASADAEKMAFRLDASKSYVSASELKDEGMVLDGAMYIDNYTQLTEFLVYLTASEPLQILNGDFAREPAYFTASTYTTYTQWEDETTKEKPLNSALWISKIDEVNMEQLAGEAADPTAPVLKFEVHLPKGLAPGQYELNFRQGAAVTSAGMKVPYFTAMCFGKDVDVDLKPFVLTVEPDALRGDVNCDGRVDMRDAMLALTYFDYHDQLMFELTDEETAELFGTPYIHAGMEAGDVDRDGRITLKDANYILCYSDEVNNGYEPEWDEIIH